MNSDRDSLYMKQQYYNKPLRRLPSSNAEQIKFSHSLRSDSDSRRTSTVTLLNPWSSDASSSNHLTLQTKVLAPDLKPEVSLRINACPNLQVEKSDRRETINKHLLKYLHKDFPSSPNIFDISKSSVLREYLMITFPAKRCFSKKMKSQIKAQNQKSSFSHDIAQYSGSSAIDISTNCILSDPQYKEDARVSSIANLQKIKELHHEYVCVSSSPIKIEVESKLQDQEQIFDRSQSIKYDIHFSELSREHDQPKEQMPFISQNKLFDCRQNLQYASIAQPMRRKTVLESDQSMQECKNSLDISFNQIVSDVQEVSFQKCQEIPQFKGFNRINNDENSSLNFNKTSQQILLGADKVVELQQHKIMKEPNFKLESTMQQDIFNSQNQLQVQISTLEETQHERVERSVKTDTFQLQLLNLDRESQPDQIQLLSQQIIFLDNEMGSTYQCETSPQLPRITNIERNRKKLDDIKKLISRGAQRKQLDRSPEVIIQSPQILSTHQQQKKNNNVVPSSPTLRQARQINQHKVEDNSHFQKSFRSVSLGKASGGKLMQMSFIIILLIYFIDSQALIKLIANPLCLDIYWSYHFYKYLIYTLCKPINYVNLFQLQYQMSI